MCGNEAGKGSTLQPGALVGRGDIELRRVDVEADEIVRRGNDLQFIAAVNFGAAAPAYCRNPSVYLPFRITPRKPEFSSRVAISAARTFSGVSNRRHAGGDVLGRTDPGARASMRADRLHGKAVRQRDVVTDLVDFRSAAV